MARKKQIEGQTIEEKMFGIAVKAIGRNITTGEVRFYMKLTELINKDKNFKIAEVIELAKISEIDIRL